MKKLFDPNILNRVILIAFLSLTWSVYAFMFNSFNYAFGFVFSVFYTAVFLFLTPEKKYYFILFTLPFASIFKIASGLPSTIVLLYLLYIIHVISQKNMKIKTVDCLLLLLIILFQFISITIYQGSYANLLSFILNIIFMKVCILSFIHLPDKNRVLFNSVSIFGIAMSLSIVIADIFPDIPYIVMWEKQTLLMSINRFSGLNADPNYYSQLVLVAICLLIASLFTKQKTVRLLVFLLCMFLVVSGFRSISKSYALSMVVILTASFYYFINSLPQKSYIDGLKKILSSIVIINAGIISLILVIREFVIPIFEKRTETNDILTGRGDIWKDYIELLTVKPEILSIGVGFSNDANILGKELGVYMAPHNVYLELAVGCGLIGIFLLLILFRDLFKKCGSTIKSPFFMYILIFSFTSFGLSISSNDAFFILIPLIILFGTGVNSNEKISNYHTYTS